MPVNGDKTRRKKAAAAVVKDDVSSQVPIDIFQRCLDIFKEALWTSNDDLNTVQTVKGHLYNRDFAQAFGKPEYLRAYALRWSASRALGYAAIFDDVLNRHMQDMVAGQARLRVVSLGGGAGAEVVGLAGCMAAADSSNTPQASIAAVDIAAWSEVIEKLHHSIVTAPSLSAYASAAAQEANKAFLSPNDFEASFTKIDCLDWSQENVSSTLSGCHLVTVMFTLNELYAASATKTQRLLNMITAAAELDALLLVVDSPGSYSMVSINGNEKKYPMQWLLDVALLGTSKAGSSVTWEKVVSEDSQWFRLPASLRYPIDLENMRYQIHLYRRLGGAG